MSQEKNGDEKMPLSTHIVETVDVVMGLTGSEEENSRGIAAGYARLNQRAKDDDSIIVSTVQSQATYVLPGEPGVSAEAHLVTTLTSQRMSREDLERQQRALHIAQGGPRR